MDWYPRDKKELERVISSFVVEKKGEKADGIVVPHAGYFYSGEIAGKGYSFLKKKERAVIIGPNHYLRIGGFFTHSKDFFETPFGKIKVSNSDFLKVDISLEHSIGNQIPFLQFLGFKEVLPLVVSSISVSKAEEVARVLSKIDASFVFSSDLSHFLSYEEAVSIDKKTIKAIENLDESYILECENCACGIFPLLVLVYLCKIKGWKPKSIVYKNSGDVTGDKKSVVGYCSIGLWSMKN